MMLFQLIAQQPSVIVQVLKATPVWVWALLAGLVALGLSQARRRQASLARIAIVPVAMTGFALSGMVSAFGATALLATAVLAWFAAAGVVFALVARGEAPGSYDAHSRRFDLPGSWVPLALILGIFLTKYVVNVEMAMQPQLARDATFAVWLSALYGAFSGMFAGRTARLLRKARQPSILFA